MARRSPARVRAATRRTIDVRVATPSGLSPRGVAFLVELERTRLWPGAAAELLRAWEGFVRSPLRRQHDPDDEGCGYGCCLGPYGERRILDVIANALPPKDARNFRKRVAALDELL
jgi:hypothetical protein